MLGICKQKRGRLSIRGATFLEAAVADTTRFAGHQLFEERGAVFAGTTFTILAVKGIAGGRHTGFAGSNVDVA